MTDLVIVAAEVSPVVVHKQMTGPALVAIDAGEIVLIDPTTGKFDLAGGATAPLARAVGMALTSGIVDQTITVLISGMVDLGNVLTAEAIDELLELSDTLGKIDDGGGGTVAKIVGRVVPAFGAVTADKLLFVDFPINSA